jgi:hypothetical protein
LKKSTATNRYDNFKVIAISQIMLTVLTARYNFAVALYGNTFPL